LRARDAISGIDYEASTFFRLAPVSISGRVVLGSTVPETVSLDGIKIYIGKTQVETDIEGRFSVAGVPSGEVNIRANIYERRKLETGKKYTFKYRAQDSFDLSGKTDIELTLERRSKNSKGGKVKLLSHLPSPAFEKQVDRLSESPELTIKAHARFKLINLISNPIRFPDWDIKEKAELYCRKAYKRGWHIRNYCSDYINSYREKPVDVWADPKTEDARLGQLHFANHHVWFVSEDTLQTAKIIPEYHLSDWGYGAFGYAVTVLDLEDGKAAIHLPNHNEAGWINIPETYKNPETSYHIGFSALASCGTDLADQHIILEHTDEVSFTYREPTPHGLWSAYDGDTEQPPLGEHDSITLDWRQAYSANRKLLLIPTPGKEC